MRSSTLLRKIGALVERPGFVRRQGTFRPNVRSEDVPGTLEILLVVQEGRLMGFIDLRCAERSAAERLADAIERALRSVVG